MLWFGGFSGSGAPHHLPLDRRHIWPTVPNAWRVGNGPDSAVRVAQTAHRSVAVIGTCGAPPDEIMHLAQHGATDTVAWRWPGSYTVIQVDDRGTTVWTDLADACPVYYTGTDHGVYWSSSARALAGMRSAGVDRDTLAARLLVPGVPALVARRSAFAGVCMVPAGHRLVLPIVGQPQVGSVWQPRPRPGDHPARLRAELSAAVSLRVDTAAHPTADLSGGYDSSTLALLAAERLSPDRAVAAVTVHPEGVTDGGDLTYAHLVAEHPGIAHRLLPIGATQLPYSSLEGLPATDEPAPSTVAYARFSAQLDWMREVCRSDSHLTGDGGDTLLCSPPMMLADLIHARRYRRALGEALAWSRLRRISALPLLAEAGRTARTSREAALGALERAVRMGRAGADTMAGWYGVAAAPAWATPQVRQRAVDVAEEAADLAGLWPVRDLTAYVIAEAMAEVGRTARADAQLAEAAGIALHNPFIDSRVVDTCLAIPLVDRPGLAEYKPILRAAMADLFPAQLARRTTKGSYTSDYYGGIRANLNALSELADGRLVDLGLVDPAAFRRTLRLAAAGVQAAYVTVEPVIRTEVWLRTLDAAPAVPWTHQDHQDVRNIPGAA